MNNKKREITEQNTFKKNLISQSEYSDLFDNSNKLNEILDNNFYFYRNISNLLLSDYYKIYKKTVDDLYRKLDTEQQKYMFEPLKQLTVSNEAYFYNSFTNVMVNTRESLDKVVSAIETSTSLINSVINSCNSFEEKLQDIFDAPDFLFQRLNTYNVLPRWSYSLRTTKNLSETFESNNVYDNPSLRGQRFKAVLPINS
jgi:hypothetical protein